MLYHFIAILVVVSTFGPVAPSPLISDGGGNSKLGARGNRKPMEVCDRIQKNYPGYSYNCFYQDESAREGGVTMNELLKWWNRLYSGGSKLREEGKIRQYTLDQKGCRQVSCIGEHANINICNLQSNSPPQNHTWTEGELMGAAFLFRRLFAAALSRTPGDPNSPRILDSCCSSYYNRDRQARISDRVWGVYYPDNNTGLKITVEPIRQPINQSAERVLCDPTKDLIPTIVDSPWGTAEPPWPPFATAGAVKS
ncbi:hypothetical protein TWF281_002757 [Arthrobotrys megalospora]